MEITNTEIAKCALCSEGAVRKAIERGRIRDCESLVAFCLSTRMKGGRLDVIDEVAADGLPKKSPGSQCGFGKPVTMANVGEALGEIDEGGVDLGAGVTLVPDETQSEGTWG